MDQLAIRQREQGAQHASSKHSGMAALRAPAHGQLAAPHPRTATTRALTFEVLTGDSRLASWEGLNGASISAHACGRGNHPHTDAAHGTGLSDSTRHGSESVGAGGGRGLWGAAGGR